MQKGNFFQRMLRAAENKGFYMILGLCLVAVGISAYVLFFTTPKQEARQGEMLSGNTVLPNLDASELVPKVTLPEKDDTPEPVRQKPTVPEPEDEPPAQTITPKPPEDEPVSNPEPPSNAVQVGSTTTVKEPIFTLPIQASQVQREYSGDNLVYDPTMCDWRTHGGTDFACDEGDAVMAVLDGTVVDIYQDAMKGHCILVDHGAGLQSRYCGLSVQDGLRTGQQVNAGQTIGRAAKCNLSESAQDCHLHLEMTDQGVLVDPMSILK